MRRGEVIVTQVAAIGGQVLIGANAGRLPFPAPAAGVVAGLGLLLMFAVLYRGAARAAGSVEPAASDIPDTPAGRRDRRTYWGGVAAAIAAMWLGASLLDRLGHPGLFVPWSIAVVGAHFLPAAAAFRATAYRLAGWVLVALGVAGAALGLAVGGAATAFAAVLAGLALYALAGGWFSPATTAPAPR